MTTIYDVADRAGVSIKTVSRVMNAEPNVRAEMRERVQAAAAALDYHPSRSARSLAGSRSFLIAVFVDAKLTLEHWNDQHGTDYLARIQLGATLPCRDAGYHVLVELIDPDARALRQNLGHLLAGLKPDGVILTPPSTDDALVLNLLRQSRTPYVRLGPSKARGGGLRLRMKDEEAARAMTEHLIGLGHRRIGFVEGDPRYASSRSRRAGFLRALSARGLDPSWIAAGDYTYASGLAAGRSFLAAPVPPTAILAGNDDMALGCLAAAAALGLQVPHDLSVAGFDDSTGARFSLPQLTTLRQPIVECAAFAARRLIAGTVAPDCDEEGGAELPGFTVIPRASTAAPAAA